MKFEQKSWNLKDVLPSHSGPRFDAELKELRSDLEEFERLKGTLSAKISVGDLRSALGVYERIQGSNARFNAYAYMYFSQDTTSQEARAFLGRMDELDADVSNRTVFFNLWLTKLDEETANNLMAQVNGDYAHYIRRLRKKKRYLLDEPV